MAADVTALHFGDADHRLYGVFHGASGHGVGPVAAVVCPSFGNEYQRAHRATAQLATRLSNLGCGVLRFDWTGTGDSWGHLTDASLDRWALDLKLATDEARRRSGASPVVVVGLRLGATVAALATERTGAVDGLVLWDPVVRGGSFFEDGLAEHRDLLTRLPGAEPPATGPTQEVCGFDYPSALVGELSTIDLSTCVPRARRRFTLSSDGSDLARLRERWARIGASRDKLLTAPRFWRGDAEKALVVAEPIEAIADWIGETFAP